jgi:hypothetical protein
MFFRRRNPNDSMTITNDKGREFTVRLIKKGDGYGRGRVVRWDSEEPGFEIYDRTYAGQKGFEPEGQIVSQYYVCTIAEVKHGIDLHGGVPEWKIDTAAFVPVVQWAQRECAQVPEIHRIGQSNNETRRQAYQPPSSLRSTSGQSLKSRAKPQSEQIIDIRIAGKQTPVRIIVRPDGDYAAGTQKKIGRKYVNVIGQGSNREAALHDMLAKFAAT